jgi:hypothetical protein
MTLTVSYWIDLIGYSNVYAKAEPLRRSQFDKSELKSGRISFLDVLSAVPPFSEGLLAVEFG